MEGSSKPRTPSPTPGDGSERKSGGKGSNVDGKTVKITVQMQNTKDVTFNIKRNAPLGKLMLNYCLELGLNYKAFKFTYLGKQVKDCETPLDLQMEGEDVIDCWSDQSGGHGRGRGRGHGHGHGRSYAM